MALSLQDQIRQYSELTDVTDIKMKRGHCRGNIIKQYNYYKDLEEKSLRQIQLFELKHILDTINYNVAFHDTLQLRHDELLEEYSETTDSTLSDSEEKIDDKISDDHRNAIFNVEILIDKVKAYQRGLHLQATSTRLQETKSFLVPAVTAKILKHEDDVRSFLADVMDHSDDVRIASLC